MDEIRHLRELANTARHEAAPRIDVTARVLRAIAQPDTSHSAGPNRVLGVLALAAVLAAAVTLGIAWQELASCSDPLQGLFGTLSMVMQ